MSSAPGALTASQHAGRACAAIAIAVVATVLMIALASCSQGGVDTRASSRRTAPSTATTGVKSVSSSSATSRQGRALDNRPTTTTAREVMASYRAFWRARYAANRGVPNPNDPALRRFAIGAQLKAVVAETQSNLARGLAFRLAAHPAKLQRITVVSVDRDRAVVQECVVSDGVMIRRDTRAIVGGDVSTDNVRGELLRIDGVWKVSSTRLVQRWRGVAGCALASS